MYFCFILQKNTVFKSCQCFYGTIVLNVLFYIISNQLHKLIPLEFITLRKVFLPFA